MSTGTRHPRGAGGPSTPQREDRRNQGGHGANGEPLDPPPSPYNFVPLSAFVHLPDWAAQVSHDVPFEDGYCGYIDYELVAKTPLLVAGDSGPNREKVFATRLDAGGKQVRIIPGSSLRGMLRTVLEIASFGKFQRVSNRALSLRDISTGGALDGLYGERLTEVMEDGAFRARSRGGWLRYDAKQRQWWLRPCEIARVDHDVIAKFIPVANRPPSRSRDGAPLTAYEAYGRWLRKGKTAADLAVKFLIEHAPEDRHQGSVDKRTGRKKWFVYKKVKAIRPPNDPDDLEQGTLVFTGSVGRKHREFIFYTPRGQQPRDEIPVSRGVIAAFNQVHAKQGEGKEQEGTSSPKDTLENLRRVFTDESKGIPVFYLSENDKRNRPPVAIGLSQMFRLAYEKSLHEAIESVSAGHFSPQPDLAELIFGRVAGRAPQDRDAVAGDRTLRGRVAFDTLDEQAVNGQYAKELSPPAVILGSPRPSFIPYYLHQPSADTGTKLRVAKDSKGKELYKPNSGKKRISYSGLSAQAAVSGPDSKLPVDRQIRPSYPRGWKRYPVRALKMTEPDYPLPAWHQKPNAAKDDREHRQGRKDSDMAVSLRPLDAGATFTGRIRFHNLREAELSALLWTMTWGKETPRKQWHSLGMGKPFGWGGCTLKVTKIEARRNEWDEEAFVDLTKAVRPGIGADPVLRDAFEHHMESVYAEWNDEGDDGARGTEATWSRSEQIQELRAMADPAMAEGSRLEQLRYPRLQPEHGRNDFGTIKKDRLVLPRYGGHWADSGSREDRERAERDAIDPTPVSQGAASPPSAVVAPTVVRPARPDLAQQDTIGYVVKGVVESPEIATVLQRDPQAYPARWLRNALIKLLNEAKVNGAKWSGAIRREGLADLVAEVQDDARRREIVALILECWEALGLIGPQAKLSKGEQRAYERYRRDVR
jgi:CRISPR-associated protein (TIGR03986 family)